VKPIAPDFEVIILENEHDDKRIEMSFKKRESLYGITKEQFLALAEKQNNACASCLVDATGLIHVLCVDHDHYTNEIRGLLCHDCNTAAGWLSDDPIKAEQLAAYLRNNGTGLYVPVTGA
jgi:Recombination endonuclease VII